MNNHLPVMLKEAIDSLKIKPNGIYIDFTIGYGGHASEIMKRLDTGMLIGFDKDRSAIQASNMKLATIGGNYKLFHIDFKDFLNKLAKLGIERVDGILADLGVSSPQVDNQQRGFSYNKNAPLDMRMNQDQKLSAYDVVNSYSEVQLVRIFRYFADVKLPQRVAKGIIANRPIKTTLELVNIIKQSLPAPIVRQKNPAKAVFQAIRIAVNGELDALKLLLEQATPLLNPGGSLAIITFHSLEDRIVKNFFGQLTRDLTGKLPIVFKRQFIAKKRLPSEEEINKNKRSRSARLRVLNRLEG